MIEDPRKDRYFDIEHHSKLVRRATLIVIGVALTVIVGTVAVLYFL